MIVVAGYLQYSYNNSGSSGNDSDDISVSQFDEETESLGEAWYVDNTTDLQAGNKEEKKDEKSENSDKKENKQDNKALQASKEANEFFAQAKMDKDVRQRTQAYERMLKLLENSDKEMRIEQ